MGGQWGHNSEEGAPERQGSEGNPCWGFCQALQTGWLSEERRVKRKPVTLYSPRGDFKSIVKTHGGKIKIYLCRQGEHFLYVQILGVFSYPFSLWVFFTKVFSRLVCWTWVCTLYWATFPHIKAVLYFNSNGRHEYCQGFCFSFFHIILVFFFSYFPILKMFTLKPCGGAPLQDGYGKLRPVVCILFGSKVLHRAVNVRLDGKSLWFEAAPKSYSPAGPCYPTVFLPLP